MTVDRHRLSAPGPRHLRRTALAHRTADLAAASSARVRLTEVPPRAMVNLRVTPGTDAATAVERALGMSLPAPNGVSVRRTDGAEVATRGAGWLGVGGVGAGAAEGVEGAGRGAGWPGVGGVGAGLEAGLVSGSGASAAGRAVVWLGPDEFLVVGADGEAPALVALPVRATDVSWARAGVAVSGPAARDLLAKGCSVDLHPSAFPVHRCAQTLLARATVLLWHHEDDGYLVLTGTSFAGYLADWLVDAAAEYAGETWSPGQVSPGATRPVS